MGELATIDNKRDELLEDSYMFVPTTKAEYVKLLELWHGEIIAADMARQFKFDDWANSGVVPEEAYEGFREIGMLADRSALLFTIDRGMEDLRNFSIQKPDSVEIPAEELEGAHKSLLRPVSVPMPDGSIWRKAQSRAGFLIPLENRAEKTNPAFDTSPFETFAFDKGDFQTSDFDKGDFKYSFMLDAETLRELAETAHAISIPEYSVYSGIEPPEHYELLVHCSNQDAKFLLDKYGNVEKTFHDEDAMTASDKSVTSFIITNIQDAVFQEITHAQEREYTDEEKALYKELYGREMNGELSFTMLDRVIDVENKNLVIEDINHDGKIDDNDVAQSRRNALEKLISSKVSVVEDAGEVAPESDESKESPDIVW